MPILSSAFLTHVKYSLITLLVSLVLLFTTIAAHAVS